MLLRWRKEAGKGLQRVEEGTSGKLKGVTFQQKEGGQTYWMLMSSLVREQRSGHCIGSMEVISDLGSSASVKR